MRRGGRGELIFCKSFCFENKVLNCKGQSGVRRIVVRIIWFDALDQYFIFRRFTKAGQIGKRKVRGQCLFDASYLMVKTLEKKACYQIYSFKCIFSGHILFHCAYSL